MTGVGGWSDTKNHVVLEGVGKIRSSWPESRTGLELTCLFPPRVKAGNSVSASKYFYAELTCLFLSRVEAGG